jgi:hypothetical protein
MEEYSPSIGAGEQAIAWEPGNEKVGEWIHNVEPEA